MRKISASSFRGDEGSVSVIRVEPDDTQAIWTFSADLLATDVIDQLTIDGAVILTQTFGPASNQITIAYVDSVVQGTPWHCAAAAAQLWFDPDGPLNAANGVL